MTIKGEESDARTSVRVTASAGIQKAGTVGGGGPSELTGGLNNTGGAVQSNGITLDTHVHTGVESGGDTTGGPQ